MYVCIRQLDSQDCFFLPPYVISLIYTISNLQLNAVLEMQTTMGHGNVPGTYSIYTVLFLPEAIVFFSSFEHGL